MDLKKYLSLLLALMLILSACSKAPLENESSQVSSEDVSSESSSEEVSSENSSEESSSEEVSGEEVSSDEASSEPVTSEPENKPVKEIFSTYKEYYQNIKKTTGTYTGRPALEKKTLTATDPENSAGLSEKSNGYSFGVAKNEKPHQTSVNHQKRYEDKGYNALTVDMKTNEKVLYLTFDCGYDLGYTIEILKTLDEKDVKAAFFCTKSQIVKNPELTALMIDEGHIVANHSVNHKAMPTISRQEMADEIEGVENYLRTEFGYSSKYYRYPTGAYSDNSLECTTSLGFRSVFWSVAHADWDPDDQPSVETTFETVTSRLHPGAVILLHNVSESNTKALGDIIDYAHKNGYVFKSLDDYSGWLK